MARPRNTQPSPLLVVNGLLEGHAWSGTVTYAFGEATPAGVYQSASTEPASAAMREAARDVFAEIERFTNLDVREAHGRAANDADIRLFIADEVTFRTGGTLHTVPLRGYAFFPGGGDEAGDVWLGTAYNHAVEPGMLGYRTLMHEIGHALGLKHPHEAGPYAVLPADLDGAEHSVMSARSAPGSPLSAGLGIEPDGWSETFMPYDIAALQHVYGADYSDRGGDRYRFDPSERVMQRTIWDGGGRDTYDFSRYATAVTIDLAPGGWSTTGQEAQLNRTGSLSTGEAPVMAEGAVYNAWLSHGDWRSGIENAIGGRGDDSIEGNRLDNRLVGGAGDDTMVGGRGDDGLFGRNDDDAMFGGGGADRIVGGHGDDVLSGAGGDDTLSGGSGRDWLDGGAGDDVLTGGGGADLFVIEQGDGSDIVRGFRPRSDVLDVPDAAAAFATLQQRDDGVLVFISHSGDSVLLSGVTLSSLSDHNFI